MVKKIVDIKTIIVDTEMDALILENNLIILTKQTIDIFLKTALELGADYVATGHYCQKKQFESNGKIIYQLLAGADKNKDQSYFLCQLTQMQLEYALFPIGHLQKSEVRTIAQKYGLATAEKKDSQGLCFVGKIKLPVFLQQQLKQKTGDVIEIPANSKLYAELNNKIDHESDFEKKLKLLSKSIHYRHEDGSIIGKHQGAPFFTIGQRKGIGPLLNPYFVHLGNWK
jgi:tRNA-specific 2-thiouridylase